MRKIWLLVILLGIVTAVVLAYTWRNIPYLNTWLIDSGVISTVQGATSGITDAVNNLDPKSLLGIISGSVGSFLLIGRSLMTRIKEGREQVQSIRVSAQENEGLLKATFDDAKSLLTGNIDQLKEEYTELQTQKADLEVVVAMKDNAIIDVQSELGKVQQQLITEQAELKETIKQMDEYRIALEQKALPTTH